MLQPQLIAKYGYPVQTQSVQTEDGYILELHRIPHGKSGPANSTRPAVLLHHALLCSSFDWIGLGPEKSLGRSTAISWCLAVPLVAFRPSLPGCDAVSRDEHQIPAASLPQFKSPLCLYTSLLLCSFLSFLYFPCLLSPSSLRFVCFFIFFLHDPLLQFLYTSVCQTFEKPTGCVCGPLKNLCQHSALRKRCGRFKVRGLCVGLRCSHLTGLNGRVFRCII